MRTKNPPDRAEEKQTRNAGSHDYESNQTAKHE